MSSLKFSLSSSLTITDLLILFNSSFTEKRPHRQNPPLEPSWVGNNPTSDNYSLKDYLEDITDEEKQAPLRALKKMFKNAVNEMKNDINKLKSKDTEVC